MQIEVVQQRGGNKHLNWPAVGGLWRFTGADRDARIEGVCGAEVRERNGPVASRHRKQYALGGHGARVGDVSKHLLRGLVSARNHLVNGSVGVHSHRQRHIRWGGVVERGPGGESLRSHREQEQGSEQRGGKHRDGENNGEKRPLNARSP